MRRAVAGRTQGAPAPSMPALATLARASGKAAHAHPPKAGSHMHPKFYELRQRLFNEMKEHRQRHPFIAEPTFDQQPLTSELMEELMNEEHILNLLAVFGDQHPDGFYRFVAANYPELFDKWARQVAGPV